MNAKQLVVKEKEPFLPDKKKDEEFFGVLEDQGFGDNKPETLKRIKKLIDEQSSESNNSNR